MRKSIFKIAFCAGFLLVSSVSMKAQERKIVFGKELDPSYINPHTGKIQCLSYQYAEYLRETIPQEEPVREINYKSFETEDTNEVYVIPVVVHVIHSGQAVGVNQNISEARVLSQIKVLNEDYRKKVGTPGNGSNPLGVDTEIEFCLAQTDPNGNPTNGINRVNLGVANWTYNTANSIMKPQTQWNPTQYFNIWVCQFDLDEELLGFAQFPTNSGLAGIPVTGQASTDGVAIDWRGFGRNIEALGTYFNGYNRGRTTTHEMGHALGLRHIWGDNTSCTVNTSDSWQDFCPDTPPHQSPNYSCPSGKMSCSGLDMTENYMDYGNDTCLNTFTPNQKTRMRTALQNGTRRKTLLTSTVCSSSASTENFGLGMISLYPNPANDVLNLFVPDNYELSGNVTIYNTVGQVIYSASVSDTNLYSIDVSGFANGVYLVKINKENQSKTLQFIKR